MIFYNNRYRGPFEYDKFVLNTLNYSNMVNSITFNELEELDGNTLMAAYDDINKMYEAITKNGGLCDAAQIIFLKGRENFNA